MEGFDNAVSSLVFFFPKFSFRVKMLNRQEKISDLDEADAVATGPLVNVTKT